MATDVTLAQVAGYCERFGLLNRVDERGWVEAMLPAQYGAQWTTLRVDGQRQVLVIGVPRLLMVREERRAVLGQALAYVNYAILLGAFALDPADGEVTYKLPVPYIGVGVEHDQVGQCLSAVVWTLNKYLPALQQLCYGEATVEEALGLPIPGAAQALARAAAQDPPTTAGDAEQGPAGP